jgi:hypothetical protein
VNELELRSYALEQAKLCMRPGYTVEELLDAADDIYGFLTGRPDNTLH